MIIAGVPLDQALDRHGRSGGTVTPARAHSVPEAMQNSSTRSWTLSSAAMVEAPVIGQP
jgi:hypothetical protein